jgi:alcohol dehydrogenase YqhD (iron-dependent ADH family)
MTATDTAGSDKGIGLTMLFGVLAVLGAVVMAAAGFVATASLRGGLEVAESVTSAMEVNAAIGFGLAMTFAFLAVVAVQWYDA